MWYFLLLNAPPARHGLAYIHNDTERKENPGSRRCPPSAGLTLVQRLRRWPNVKLALGRCVCVPLCQGSACVYLCMYMVGTWSRPGNKGRIIRVAANRTENQDLNGRFTKETKMKSACHPVLSNIWMYGPQQSTVLSCLSVWLFCTLYCYWIAKQKWKKNRRVKHCKNGMLSFSSCTYCFLQLTGDVDPTLI